MTTWPRPDISSMNAFYGNPDTNHDGSPDLRWEADNIMRVIPPYPMVLAWDTSRKVKTISIHKKCAKSLGNILAAIAKEFTPAEREQFQLNRLGGAYIFRPQRGSHNLSKHSWGCAIDLAPELNVMSWEYGIRQNMMPMKVVDIFAAEGWKWGGLWARPDAMHFEATS